MNILTLPVFKNLAARQAGLDAKIKAANDVADLPLKRIELYYRIELGECLNELKGEFKHWSNKPMNRDPFIEELVDALHFLLSYTNHVIEGNSFFELTLETEYDQLSDFYYGYESDNGGADAVRSEVDVWEFAADSISSASTYHSFAILLHLAERLGYTEQDIIETYNIKNEVNHNRSDSGVY
ncbi:putative dUTPase [Exiguobacterium phage vB_EauS-123]|nr:putative dUTPase [Exiguobacterium phage vB_EauS-123]